MTDEQWAALGAAFGPILKEAFPDHSAVERMAVADALAEAVKVREHWFARSYDDIFHDWRELAKAADTLEQGKIRHG